MRRILALLLTTAMLAGVLTGCGGKGTADTTAAGEDVTTAAAGTEAAKEDASGEETAGADVTTAAAEDDTAAAGTEGDTAGGETIRVGALKGPDRKSTRLNSSH